MIRRTSSAHLKDSAVWHSALQMNSHIKASCEAPILSFKPRALIVSSLDQCTQNRAAVPRVKPLNRSHGWRDYCVLQATKSCLLVLKVQLYLVEYQDNLEKENKLPKQNDGVFVITIFASCQRY